MDTFYPIPGIQLSNKYPLDERSLALRADFYSIPFSAKAKGLTVCRETGISPTIPAQAQETGAFDFSESFNYDVV